MQECEDRKLGAQGGVFGVDFALVPRGFPEEVPFIVRRCTAEIESRALGVQVSRLNSPLSLSSVVQCLLLIVSCQLNDHFCR